MFAEKYITFFLGKEQLFQRSRHDQIVNRNQAENRLHSVHDEFALIFPRNQFPLIRKPVFLPNLGPACLLIFLNLTGSSIEYINTKRIIELFLRTALEDAILNLVVWPGCATGLCVTPEV